MVRPGGWGVPLALVLLLSGCGARAARPAAQRGPVAPALPAAEGPQPVRGQPPAPGADVDLGLVGRFQVAGVYPHLCATNDEDECGIGAVVPWAGRLWYLTYAPHRPLGSSDGLHSVGPDGAHVRHPESVGGTHAARFLHLPTQQLVIGPYVIDARGSVRVVPRERMPGRLTGVAAHLLEPERKVHVATMEEGLYELDLTTLAVRELYADDQGQLRGEDGGRRVARLPGYHGKGLYSGQGRVVYANNGEPGAAALVDPELPSGCLAEWDGEAWQVVRRAQFTEVSGPGGIQGNAHPADDPLWSIGWDHRSLLLSVRDRDAWHTYRLPKGSHAYDGAHGWNTEWPRIRDVGEPDLLMTMHGTLWALPRGFRPGASAGVRARSTYLRVVADVARVGERVVFGCDDVARSGFLNERAAHQGILGPGRSQSNLWFLEPEQLDQLGPARGRGALWLGEDVRGAVPSDPYLFDGYVQRAAWIAHASDGPRRVRFEFDVHGDGRWTEGPELVLEPGLLHGWVFDPGQRAVWVRARFERDARDVRLHLMHANPDPRGLEPDPIFDGIVRDDDLWEIEDLGRGTLRATGGAVRVQGDAQGHLALVAERAALGDEPLELGLHELRADPEGGRPELRSVVDVEARERLRAGLLRGPGPALLEAGSVLWVDDEGGRWRLPRATGDVGTLPAAPQPLGAPRTCREVCTERDLLHLDGTFYELPARNAGGIARLRPIASHDLHVDDFCGWRGLLVLTGVGDRPAGSAQGEARLVRAADGGAALWLGVVDDLWRLGRPRGSGGPWWDSAVVPGEPSDPYLLAGYERRVLTAQHDGEGPLGLVLELDVDGSGCFLPYRRWTVGAGESLRFEFPAGLDAAWMRVIGDRPCRATLRVDQG